MKPGNKWERRCMELSERLSDNTIKHFEFARSVLGQQAYYKRNGQMIQGTYRCCECGHEWKAQGAKTTVCPNCGCKLEVKVSKAKIFKKRGYVAIIDSCEEWMVVRHYYVEHWLYADNKVLCDMDEVMQVWRNQEGRQVVIARDKKMYPGRHYNIFNMWSDMTIKRPLSSWYGINILNIGVEGTYIEKVPKWLSYVKWKKLQRYDVLWFIDNLHKHPMVETLLKVNRPLLLCHLLYNRFFDNQKTDMFKVKLNAVRLAIKNKYRLIDDREKYNTWMEMLEQLVELKKDWHNAYYVCPKNLMEVHNKYTEKISQLKALEKAKAMEKQYVDNRKQFFGLSIRDNDIIIQPLHNIMEFYYEWRKMHHCVYSHEYFNISRHPDSLILSARMGKNWNDPQKVLETIEIDIKKFKIMQVHGFANQDSECHQRILDIMKANMGAIKKIVKETNKSKRKPKNGCNKQALAA